MFLAAAALALPTPEAPADHCLPASRAVAAAGNSGASQLQVRQTACRRMPTLLREPDQAEPCGKRRSREWAAEPRAGARREWHGVPANATG